MSHPESSLRAIAAVVEVLLLLTPAERATVARELAEADHAFEFGSMLFDAGYEHAQRMAVQRMVRSALTVEDEDIDQRMALA